MIRPLNKLKMGVLVTMRPLVLRLNRKNYKNVVWIIGSGRSGTTWVSDLINYKKQYREMIEPFRPKVIKKMSFLKLHHYLREGESWRQFSSVAKRVFHGDFYHKDIDSANNSFIYKDLLIKDVFANLLAFHISKKNPKIKTILLIRNPIDVAFSKQAKRDWIWMEDPRDFFQQENLMEDFLNPFRSLISEVGESDDFILKQVLVWSIINYVPLKQFNKEDLHVLFYEDVRVNPNREISQVYEYINGRGRNNSVEIPKQIIEKTSRVSGKKGSSSKRQELSEDQLEKTKEILRAFGFENLYSDEKTPNPKALSQFGFLNLLFAWLMPACILLDHYYQFIKVI
jgi:hypothetical protein